MTVYRSVTQFRLLEEYAEDILTQFEEQSKIKVQPPIPIRSIAELMGVTCREGNLAYLHEGTSGVLFEDDGVIVVNAGDKEERQRFTMAHEIGHHRLPRFHDTLNSLLLYGEDVFTHPEKRTVIKERACNKFAGALLIPRMLLKAEFSKNNVITDKLIFHLAKLFQVSPPAMLNRLEYLARNQEPLLRIDWLSLKQLRTSLFPPTQSKQTSFHNSLSFTVDQKVMIHDKLPPVVQAVENKLFSLGLISAVYRNGATEVEAVKTPFETLGRPMIIEFAGTPNSGKDTQIEILADFLRYYRGYRVTVIDEIYHTCTVANRHDYKLYWMFSTTIQKLVNMTEEDKFDVVIFNRGAFDILAFIQLYYLEGHISKKELTALSSSITTKKLSQLVDIIFLMKTPPEVSMDREIVYPRSTMNNLAEILDDSSIHPEPTLTNKDGLAMINECYDKVLDKYGKAFKKIHSINDDGNKTIDDIAIVIGKHIHSSLLGTKHSFQKELLLQRRKPIKVVQLDFSSLIVNSTTE